MLVLLGVSYRSVFTDYPTIVYFSKSQRFFSGCSQNRAFKYDIDLSLKSVKLVSEQAANLLVNVQLPQGIPAGIMSTRGAGAGRQIEVIAAAWAPSPAIPGAEGLDWEYKMNLLGYQVPEIYGPFSEGLNPQVLGR